MLQLLNTLFWVSRDILVGGDEFALARITCKKSIIFCIHLSILVYKEIIINREK